MIPRKRRLSDQTTSEKMQKTGHATRYEARVEKAKAVNNNGNAQTEQNMKLSRHKKEKIRI